MALLVPAIPTVAAATLLEPPISQLLSPRKTLLAGTEETMKVSVTRLDTLKKPVPFIFLFLLLPLSFDILAGEFASGCHDSESGMISDSG